MTPMTPLTPPPPKAGVLIEDIHVLNDKGEDRKNVAASSSPYFPAPPLYYNKNSSSSSDRRGKGESKKKKQTGETLVVVDKKGNRFIPRSPVFVPVGNSEERSMMRRSYQASTPPISPYHPKPNKVNQSPAPSLMSLSTSTETYNSDSTAFYSLSPDPSTCYFISASPSSYAGNRYHPVNSSSSSSRCSTPTTNYIPNSPRNLTTPTSVKTTSPTKKRTPEDQSRRQRLKTELCMHYKKNFQCPFGSECTYAHGVEELQMKRLMDLQRAGLIEDAETYRTKPCWTWVATGSCPFGRRCVGIHDPRITGLSPSWLPHTETQGNSLPTDINVDGLHQKRMHAILYGNPFGDQFSLELDDWADLYKLVCNTTSNNKRRRNILSEIHKLSIALQMRGESGWMYKYRPQHVVYNTLCMVLQKRAFILEKSGRAVEIPLSKFRANNSTHVLVRELAFGPDSDPTVRGVALYFNIAESDVAQCTPQQAKRFRWKKGLSREPANTTTSVFDTRECFTMIRPYDREAFDLATCILRHRWETAHAERLTALNERFEAINKLEEEKELLKNTFLAHKRNWINWYWPISNGRQIIDDDTPVPPVDTEYLPMIDQDAIVDKAKEAVKGSAIQPLWDSFVLQTAASSSAPSRGFNKQKEESPDRKRLSIFLQLGCGQPINQNRSLPHIKTKLISSLRPQPDHSFDRQSERCWRALLLKQEEKHQAGNEWNIVKERFQNANARVKKVLGIVQN